MTTIAYKDGVLASDSLSCWGNSRDGAVTKIRKRGPYLAAISGVLGPGQKFLDWFSAGMNGDPPERPQDDNIHALGFIFMPDGMLLTLTRYGWERSKSEHCAAGSGAEFATGAMSMGATAAEAVAVAMKHDTHTGGEITVLTHQ